MPLGTLDIAGCLGSFMAVPTTVMVNGYTGGSVVEVPAIEPENPTNSFKLPSVAYVCKCTCTHIRVIRNA